MIQVSNNMNICIVILTKCLLYMYHREPSHKLLYHSLFEGYIDYSFVLSSAYITYCDRGLGRVSLESHTRGAHKIKMRFNGMLNTQVSNHVTRLSTYKSMIITLRTYSYTSRLS